MDKEQVKNAVANDKIFKVGYSFYFAVQVPDNTVGISGSRCSNCNGEVVYCEQVCKHCNMPFIGPFGFQQLSIWKTKTSAAKRMLVEEIYSREKERGRLEYIGVNYVPLTPVELVMVEKLECNNDFFSAHGIYLHEIRERFFI